MTSICRYLLSCVGSHNRLSNKHMAITKSQKRQIDLCSVSCNCCQVKEKKNLHFFRDLMQSKIEIQLLSRNGGFIFCCGEMALVHWTMWRSCRSSSLHSFSLFCCLCFPSLPLPQLLSWRCDLPAITSCAIYTTQTVCCTIENYGALHNFC